MTSPLNTNTPMSPIPITTPLPTLIPYLRSCLTSEVMAVCVFSYFGVFVRVAIVRGLTDTETIATGGGGTGNGGYTGYKGGNYNIQTIEVFFQLFYNTYFVPNVIGCFIVAPLYHRRQSIIRTYGRSAYTGMVTGFCGCLTTFSSWMYGVGTDMFGIGVLPTIILLVIQIALLQSSLLLGFSASHLVDDVWALLTGGGGTGKEGTGEGAKRQETTAIGAGSFSHPPGGQKEGAREGEGKTGHDRGDDPVDVIPLPDDNPPLDADTQGSIKGDSNRDTRGDIIRDINGDDSRDANRGINGGARGYINDAQGDDRGDLDGFECVDLGPTVSRDLPPLDSSDTNTDTEAGRVTKRRERIEFVLWSLLFSLLTIAIWVMLIVCSYSPLRGNKNPRSYLSLNIDPSLLRSTALAPYGALIRYALWRVPWVAPRLASRVPSLKVPTLAANLLGTLMLSAVTGFDGDLYSGAFSQGFCGSFTTASTLMLELHLLHSEGRGQGGQGGGGPLRSIGYLLCTFIGGMLIPLFFLWGEKGPYQ